MPTDTPKTKTHLADYINNISMKQLDERLKFLSDQIDKLMTETTPLQEEFAQLRETKKEMRDFVNANSAEKKV